MQSELGGSVMRKQIRKMFGKKFVRIYLLCLLPLAVSFIWGQIDYYRVDQGGEPVFSWPTRASTDGGSQTYVGFGYGMYSKHTIASSDEGHISGHMVGPRLDYWIPVWPFQDRENIRFEPAIFEE